MSMFSIRLTIGLRLMILGLRIVPNDWARALMKQRFAEMIVEVTECSKARKAALDAEIERCTE